MEEMKWVFGIWELVCISIVLGWLFYKYLIVRKWGLGDNQEEERRLQPPRGSSGWPLIGETIEFIASGFTSRPVSFMEKRKSLYGKVFKTHILGRPIIVSTDPDVNKVVLQNQGNVFIPSYPKSVIELLGESSILQINGGLQKRLHAIIGGFLRSPQFKARITKDIENSVKLALSSWIDRKNTHHPIIYLQDETKKITFQILVRVLMSVEPGEDMEFLKREFMEVIKGLICLPIKLPGFRMYKSLQAKERMLKMVRKIVYDRKMAMEKKETKDSGSPNDAIDVLLRDTGESDGTQQRLPLDFISGNIIEMMIPGEDSVPMIMTLAVKYLSDNPVALACLMEENDELKKRKDESGEGYAWTDYVSLPFTQGVISETLRMANIINAIWRKAVEDVEIKGYLIPKGWCVLASLTSVHMDEENYENPDEFDPWRWEKTGASVNSNKFTPFGGGQRLCPGLEFSRLEISIFLHHFVTSYTWVAEEDQIVYFPTVKTKRKLPIMVTPR
ncbi:3-epi-6-deoxocathasterone 23-monooxygenase CYP90C1 [Lactuca sativa]|uniref:3-epi-6-deoxocathasterone 23-monooxygenase CYP90C1 n=1 Tax=Lactuca sativa TaxID=4236 RepID=UPI000CBC05EE|nr:3-epi-6-deoxocathasterone 23-monooxygenase CYP90C1 [Lactuca sativa]